MSNGEAAGWSPQVNHEAHRDYRYMTPRDLSVSRSTVSRAVVIGSCATGDLPRIAATLGEACEIDFFLVNHGCWLPDVPPSPLSAYDFQIIQIPIRTIIPESRLMRLAYDDVAGHHSLFDDAATKLDLSVQNVLRWTREGGVPAFVTNFPLPQQNPFGRLMPRYDVRNLVHFVELLNQRLATVVASHSDAYLLDLDQLCAVFGRKNFQDDATSLFVHGAFLSDYDFSHDQHRLEPVSRMSEQYGAKTDQILSALWEEACAMHRTLRQTDAVKLIIVDLDDTLWRGVVAEGEDITSHTTEGWPVGFVEALLYLKRRGVLLAIVSKNDCSRIESLWAGLYGGRMELSDFAAVRINWRSKADNVAEVLADVSLLPGSVVFIDDNPVERAAVSSAFPDIRVLGSNPYHLRRIMLWSSELQASNISSESLRRTEMVQSQTQRQAARQAMSRAEFLASVAPRVAVFAVGGPDHPKFERCLELLNKTNQFNSTGRRWTKHELQAALTSEHAMCAFEVEDRYTQYGLVGVLIFRGSDITQFVMSCRVLGLDVEIAVLGHLTDRLLHRPIVGRVVETDANLPVRDLYLRAGFERVGGHFELDADSRVPPSDHAEVTSAIGEAFTVRVSPQPQTPELVEAYSGPTGPLAVAQEEGADAREADRAASDRPKTAWEVLLEGSNTLAADHPRQLRTSKEAVARGWLDRLLSAGRR